MNNSKILEFIRRHYPILVIFALSLILCFTNYIPGTFLSGWDTLHPEFDFALNFKRIFFGVFRTEQGLGAVGAHSHMADLPRIIILYLLHFILPLHFLRYAYVFLTLVTGAIGMYFLLEKAVIKEKTISMLGAVFYLLNIGTYQTFVVPFEMFTTLYATLPFIFLFAHKFILEINHKRRNLILFCVFMFLNTPAAYAATLWYVFIVCFTIFVLSMAVLNRVSLKLPIILFSVTFLVNAYWLLPNFYFLATHSLEVQNANINKLFSEQAFLINKQFGNLPDILLLKSFYFDWTIYEGTSTFKDLTAAFSDHFKRLPVLVLGYSFAALFIVGLIFAVKSKMRESLPYALILLPSAFFLINDNFPFSGIFTFLQSNVPLFKEALRFPGDKIINIYTFIFTIFFSLSLLFLSTLLKKINFRPVYIFAPIILTALIVFYMLPAFSGNFINPRMKVNLPEDYFNLFSYVKNQQTKGKIAIFPVHSPWGWIYYDFEGQKYPLFQGAGFLYFGLNSPLLDRDFDRWNIVNENYYREISYAVYRNDLSLFSNVVKKYNIAFLLIDKNVISIPNPSNVLYFNQIEKLISQSGLAAPKQTFGNIDIYKIKNQVNLVETKTKLTAVLPHAGSFYRDDAYLKYSDYISFNNISEQENYTPSIFFPYRNIINNQFKVNEKFIKIIQDKIVFDSNLPADNYTFDTFENNQLLPADLVAIQGQNTLNISFYPNIAKLDGNSLSSSISAIFTTVANQNPTIVTINQQNIFNIPALIQNVYTPIGKTYLNNSGNYIALYSDSNRLNISDPIHKINPVFTYCNNDNNSTAVSAYILNDKIQITGTDDVCVTIPIAKLIDKKLIGKHQELLLTQSFSYTGDSSVLSCIEDIQSGSCIYYPKKELKEKNFSFMFPVKTSDLDNLAIKLILTYEDNQIKMNEVSKLVFTVYSPVQQTLITSDLIRDSFTKENVFKFSKVGVPNNSAELKGSDAAKIDSLKNTCKTASSISDKKIFYTNNQKVIKYTSLSGSFCDQFAYDNLPHNQAYLVTIESKNEKGLPLSFCLLNNISKRCDIFTTLGKWGNFNKDVFLLPPSDTQGTGYNISLENIGIKGSTAINYIKSIGFIPVPIELIQNIRTEKGTKINSYSGQIVTSQEYNPLLILITLKGETPLINLNYSYENGFKAYFLSCGNSFSCGIKSYLAPIFGKEIKQHVLVNNWSNGWILPKNMDTNQKVVVTFLPQYLEFFGFILLILNFGGLIFLNIQKR